MSVYRILRKRPQPPLMTFLLPPNGARAARPIRAPPHVLRARLDVVIAPEEIRLVPADRAARLMVVVVRIVAVRRGHARRRAEHGVGGQHVVVAVATEPGPPVHISA